jgi:hypothetical protein
LNLERRNYGQQKTADRRSEEYSKGDQGRKTETNLKAFAKENAKSTGTASGEGQKITAVRMRAPHLLRGQIIEDVFR